MPRSYSDCCQRVPHSVPSAQGSAHCLLLGQIAGIDDRELLTVSPDECEACCESFVPTPQDWNPVIASLLYRVADQAVSRGGVEGLSLEDATSLREAALLNLPLVLPHEDDCIDDAQTYARPQGITLEALTQRLPLPSGLRHPASIRWAVGVTTAPRRQPTLSASLESLIASGWSEPLLSLDGPVEIDSPYAALPRIERPAPIGAWPAWCETVQALLDKYADANMLMLVQDDALFPAIPCLREYVESVLNALPQPGLLSLYTSSEDMQPGQVWQQYTGVWKYGAVVFVLPRELAQSILASNRRGELNVVERTAGIDMRIGVWADRNQVPLWHPSPSLIQHIGQVSSIWKRSRAVGLRRASRFIADEIGPG